MLLNRALSVLTRKNRQPFVTARDQDRAVNCNHIFVKFRVTRSEVMKLAADGDYETRRLQP